MRLPERTAERPRRWARRRRHLPASPSSTARCGRWSSEPERCKPTLWILRPSWRERTKPPSTIPTSWKASTRVSPSWSVFNASTAVALKTFSPRRAARPRNRRRVRRTRSQRGAARSRSAAARNELERQAAALTALRKKAASRLAKRVVAEFGELALGAGRFEVCDRAARTHRAERCRARGVSLRGQCRRAGARARARGIGRRAFARAARAGRHASAVREVRDAALVFDEIDAGIGGATATAVGARIGALGQARAGRLRHAPRAARDLGRPALRTRKDRNKSETPIVARPIKTAKEREGEIARMLSGESHDAALRHARTLLAARFVRLEIWWILRTLVPPDPTGMPVVNAIRSPECTRPSCTICALRHIEQHVDRA